jgi:alpha-1,3-rhamnosyl/mannosyltransferase
MHMQAARGARAGIGHYTWQLAQALTAIEPQLLRPYPTVWEQLFTGWYERQWAKYAAAPPRAWTNRIRGRCLITARRLGARSYTEQLQRVLRRERIDLYHEPCYIPLECEGPIITSVHDLSVLRFPQWHRRETVALFEKHFDAALKRSQHLLAISEFGKQEIVRYLGWPAERVSVSYMGVRPGLGPVGGSRLQRVLRRWGLRPGYLLHVGTLEPRKNVLMLMREYCELPLWLRERHPLVLVGGAGWNSVEEHDFLRGRGAASGIRWLGYVSDVFFGCLYSGARALLFPSHYEGFGMPTIEMMACGGAVIASRAGAVVETVGGVAYLVDAVDGRGWREAMYRVCVDEEWWRGLRAGALGWAARYTWQRCAEQTLAAYRKTLGQDDHDAPPTPDRPQLATAAAVAA